MATGIEDGLSRLVGSAEGMAAEHHDDLAPKTWGNVNVRSDTHLKAHSWAECRLDKVGDGY